jgi:5-amino-6-(5-phosphoribosylamino)uracil reductase
LIVLAEFSDTAALQAANAAVCRARRQNLDDRGVRRLMVVGGGTIHTQFLTADLADEPQPSCC